MRSGRCRGRSAAALALAAAVLASCGDAPSAAPREPLESVRPAVTAVTPLGRASFAATDSRGGPHSVRWSVDGVPGGRADLGTISASGEYTAPPVIPDGDSVVVGAVSTTDAARRLSATVYFLPAGRDFSVQIPRVVDESAPGPIRVLLVPPAGTTGIGFQPKISSASTPLEEIASGVYLLELSPSRSLESFHPSALHNTVGSLELRDASGATLRRGLGVNVRDPDMRPVTVTKLAPDAQRSAFVLNLRYDAVLDFDLVGPPKITRRALELLGDRFDFLAIVHNVSRNLNRFYLTVRNDVRGIGTPVVDNGAAWGSFSRLRGIINFPLDEYFDPLAVMAHEIGHAWINHATAGPLLAGRPHWPMSSLANESVMGFSIAGSGAGGTFPFGLVAQGGGMYRVEARAPQQRYSPWDLYLMGLLPADSVPPAVILPSGLQFAQVVPGFVTPATAYTIGEYIAEHGARQPAYGAAPTELAIATIVLSQGRLLSASEMAFYDAAAARIESETPMPLTTGFQTIDSYSFRAATGGRARIRSRIE